MEAGATITFDANLTRARWTIGLLAAAMGLTAVSVLFGLIRLGLAPGALTESPAGAAVAWQALIGGLRALAILGSGVAFLLWFHGAHRNLKALGEQETKFTSGWAVGGFFVPLVNLVLPVLVMREVWQGSDPRSVRASSDSQDRPSAPGTPAFLGWWWAAFLAMGLAADVVVFLAMSVRMGTPLTLELATEVALAELVTGFMVVISGILSIAVVSRITAWQRARIARGLPAADESPTSGT